MKSIKKKKFQDFIKSEAELVKYKVTGMFGMRDKGDIINGYLISVGGLTGLIYFPYNSMECGCFEICEYDEKECVWISQNKVNWVNFE
jgi:hypothetical protein